MNNHPLRIGLSPRLMHDPPAELGFPGKTLQYLEQSLAHWIMAHGAVVLMVPTIWAGADISRRQITVRDYVDLLDGLVLQGGLDVSPASYGEEPLRPEWRGDRVRDLYEIELLWEFVIQGKPVLGVCRGAQLINVALGGTLYQDIPTQCPDARVHRDDVLYDNLHHHIEIVPESGLARLYPEHPQGQVNSIHHQAVRDLGRDLRVEAVSADDGLVEAIRWQGSSYLLGCQWHPEFHAPDSPLLDSTPVLMEFLEAGRQARG